MPTIGGLHIHDDELVFTFDRSGGPGGQNVNKLSTRATLSFDLEHSPALTDHQRETLRQALRGRINKLGILRVVSSEHRTQAGNRAEALETFATLIARALRPRKTRRPSRPTKASKQRRLASKQHQKERKAQRQAPKHQSGTDSD